MLRYTVFLLALTASPVAAQDLRDFCADRPGLGTPACIVDRGHVMVESGLADWTLSRDRASRTDTVTVADTLVRLGLTDTVEAQVGWAAFGHQRQRDRLTGQADRTSGVGDLTFAVRKNLANPDGSGTSIALMPHITAPVGNAAIGAGDWAAGLTVPISTELSDTLSFALTPEIDAATDEDRHGRHLAFGSVVGLGVALGKALSATGELSVMRDKDPQGHQTLALAGLSLAWQPAKALQFDAGANVGLNHASDDVELYFGVARRF